MSFQLVNARKEDFQTTDVLDELGGLRLTKDALYYLEDRKEFLPRYDEQGTMRPPGRRSPGAQRKYSREHLEILSTVLRCAQAGFSYDEIGKLLPASSQPVVVEGTVPEDWELIPPAKLKELAHVRNRLLDAALLKDKTGLLKAIALEGRSLLNCGAFVLFPDDTQDPSSVLYEIVASGGELPNDNPCDCSDLAREFFSPRSQVVVQRLHVEISSSSRRHSVLQIPLVNRKGRRIGIFYACYRNKHGDQNGEKIREAAFFDHIDQAVGVMFATEVSLLLEANRFVESSLNVMEHSLSSPILVERLNTLLNESTTLLGADRGDLFWLDGNRGLIMIDSTGTPNHLHKGDHLPEHSLSALAFRTGRPQRLRDATNPDKDYFCGSNDTKSELAIPLRRRALSTTESKSNEFAVLNLESRIPDFFDDHDERILARLASLAPRFTETHEAVYGRLATRLNDPHTLDHILEGVERIFGFDEGLIYVADYKLGKLSCVRARPKPDKFTSIEYHFSDKPSFAAKVFRECRGTLFSAEPWKEAAPGPHGDPVFSANGLSHFNIPREASILGAPLLFDRQPVGVLIAWNRHGLRKPVKADDKRFEDYARLAITTHHLSRVDYQLYHSIHLLRDIYNTHLSDPYTITLQKLVAALTSTYGRSNEIYQYESDGFDRARIFRCDKQLEHFNHDKQGQPFTCIASAPEGFSDSITWSSEQHVKLDVDWYLKKHLDPQVLDPKNIPDPSARELGKLKGLPWALAPIIVNDRVIAYIAADCEFTAHDITNAHKDFLSLCAGLAALAIGRAGDSFAG